MYAIALIRYRQPLERVQQVVDRHRAYCKVLQDKGILLASGPFDPRSGGALLLRVPDDAVQATLDQVRDGDPYVLEGIAQYELLPWAPALGKDKLDSL
ncbi:YciI family protein [Pendulispora brunnea]|uniref:YciI family protein n=1 Tax=Pendulispora brunnea TaxID=2905690 RepID=A0ABZ2KJ46_9BACT